MTEPIDPMFLRNPDAQRWLGIGASRFWQLVRERKIEVRTVFASLKQYAAQLQAEAGAGKAA